MHLVLWRIGSKMLVLNVPYGGAVQQAESALGLGFRDFKLFKKP